MKMFLFITFLALELVVSINGIPACGPNQQYFDCGPCEQICDREPQSCIAACRQPGCYCQKGFIRASPCNSSECVLPSNCPGKCGVNEVYKPCGGCDQICNEEQIFCTQDCSRPGCYCKSGYKRESKGRSKCVPEDACPRNQCVAPEEYKCSCEQYCNEPPVACFRCEYACYCKEGYKRVFRGGFCIKESACVFSRWAGSSSTQNAGPGAQRGDSSLTQNSGQQPQQCGGNEVYRYCGCDQYCDKRPVCSSRICRPGCYCKDGYVRSSSGGFCILPETCRQCGVNEVFKECRDCDQYCNKEQVGCATVCIPGCSCLKGHKRYRGVCVPSSFCPTRCPPNEVFKKCGGCDQLCSGNPVICAQSSIGPQKCRPGCYCKDGFVRADDTQERRCIRRNQCQGQLKTCSRANEEYKCDCEQFCNKPPIFCFRCTNNCFCKRGFKRSFPGGLCVPISICPLLQGIGLPPIQNTGPGAQGGDSSWPLNGGPPRCNSYEVFKRCGCDEVCGRNSNKCAQSTLVPYNCKPDCYCRDGLVRANGKKGSKCIKPEKCRGQQRRCRINEEYLFCGGCDGYCNAGPIACAVCLPACYCKKGYVRLIPGGRCVPHSRCECNGNEVFIYCGGCDQYCNEKPRICTSLACIPGCYCRKGYKRSFRGGPCIPLSVCLQARKGEDSFVEEDTRTQVQEESFNEETGTRNQDVGLYEIEETGESSNDHSGVESSNSGSRYEDTVTYETEETYDSYGDFREFESSYSGSRYEDTVTYETEETYESYGDFREFESSYSEDESSPFVENLGSRSEDDSRSFAEDSETNPSFDQGSQGPGYNCRQDEEIQDCGVGPECEDYCGRGANACAYCKRGCYCMPGTIRAGPSNTTRCIPANQCATAQKCFENEEYSECGTACPANCDNRDPVCTKQCAAGCFCKTGFIRQHADLQTYRYKCIPVNECPS